MGRHVLSTDRELYTFFLPRGLLTSTGTPSVHAGSSDYEYGVVNRLFLHAFGTPGEPLKTPPTARTGGKPSFRYTCLLRPATFWGACAEESESAHRSARSLDSCPTHCLAVTPRKLCVHRSGQAREPQRYIVQLHFSRRVVRVDVLVNCFFVSASTSEPPTASVSIHSLSEQQQNCQF